MSFHLKRAMHKSLIFLHKWLGVSLALLFLMWFLSGLVLYYVPFPGLSQAERLAGQAPLQLPSGCCLTAQQATDKAGLTASEARLGMFGALPVWRVLAKDGQGGAPLWRAIDARNGQLLAPLPAEAAAAVAEAFSGRRAVHSELLERDQWTVPQGLNPYRPLLRVALDGPDGLELYVSPAAAEVVRDTRRAERFWNWLGAVPHWLYFTELRQYPKTWRNVVVWLSIPGVVLAVTGLVLGTWHLFLNRARWIPYRQFWMRWHHISGLVAAIFTLTWMFSGLLSMNPFGVFSPRAAPAVERMAWTGPKAAVTLNPAQALAAAPGVQAREMDVVQVAGQAWYRLRGVAEQTLVRADGVGASVPQAALPEETVQAALRALRPGAVTITRLTAYDDMYYARELNANTPYARPLPVWRAQWADGVSVYADPASSRLLLRADASNRWQRVLYNGLHSFDFAPLMARPWLQGSLIVLLSLLGTALCVTSCVIAWRVLVPRKRKRMHGRAARPA
ncbi:PepSY domain-containing protein [Polaromonas sp. UC242_47]|uniref:PepSY domain-containing protein n=1 Tax=Polaromonas sp. UC242_47 TaxID=3374626 RepID=UPI0037BBB83A